MSGITYPYLHDSPAPPLAVEADDVEESFSVAPAAPVDERHGEKQAMSAQHLSLCALWTRIGSAIHRVASVVLLQACRSCPMLHFESQREEDAKFGFDWWHFPLQSLYRDFDKIWHTGERGERLPGL